MKKSLCVLSIVFGLLLLGNGMSYAVTIERVSIDSNSNQTNGYSLVSSISADGRYVAFMSVATNLVPGDTNGVADVFVRDRATGITERVSVDSTGNQGNNWSYDPSISADGRYVTFTSIASNLVPEDTNGFHDIFVHDRVTGITERVSIDSNGNQTNGYSLASSISADGRYVAFMSVATNLVPGDTNGQPDVFVHDRVTGITEQVSVDSNGNQANGWSDYPSISADGGWVAFMSGANNLEPGDTNGTYDIFVRDRAKRLTERVSVDSNGNQADKWNGYPSISADGRNVAFGSYATNLVSGDTNGVADVFVHKSGPSIPQTPAELIAYIQSLADNGLINPGIANSLIAKIKLVQKSKEPNAAKGALGAFVKQVRALTGTEIPPDIAAILLEAAAYIKGNIQVQKPTPPQISSSSAGRN